MGSTKERSYGHVRHPACVAPILVPTCPLRPPSTALATRPSTSPGDLRSHHWLAKTGQPHGLASEVTPAPPRPPRPPPLSVDSNCGQEELSLPSTLNEQRRAMHFKSAACRNRVIIS